MPASPVSKDQAKFLGLVASGKVKKPGLTPALAKEMLEGTDMSSLPKKKGARQCEAEMFNPQDETIGGWARRRVEASFRQVALEAMEAAVPQTAPMLTPPVVAAKLRDMSDRLEVVTDLPPEVQEVVVRMNDDMDTVLKWLQETTHG